LMFSVPHMTKGFASHTATGSAPQTIIEFAILQGAD
jgi:hypothetical protein